mmetsp:Transcript_6118/g.13455  ORF Transcript_6118/g.13455 Transcript_6118/m.13455 type:complete len:171 (+) Transcript_6118:121-633(+)
MLVFTERYPLRKRPDRSRAKTAIQLFVLIVAFSIFSAVFFLDHRSPVDQEQEEQRVVRNLAAANVAGTPGPLRTSTTDYQDKESPTPADTNGSNAAKPSDHVYDVLIIGSGWSGVGAATALTDAGIANVEILEARDYVGGRSRTVSLLGRSGRRDGQRVGLRREDRRRDH